MAFSHLRERLLTAGVLVAFLATLLLLSQLNFCWARWLLSALAFAMATLCASEMARVCSKGAAQKSDTVKGLTYFFIAFAPIFTVVMSLRHGVPCPSGAALDLGYFVLPRVAAVCGLACVLTALVRGARNLEGAGQVFRELPLGFYHTGLCGAMLVLLTFEPNAGSRLFWLFLVVCLNDTAAYFAGSRLRGPKLAPAISPNKTVSGSVAGIITGVIVGMSASSFLVSAASLQEVALFSAVVVLAAQAGDLAKSYLKRLHGVKDTGTLFPGHGGVYDRLDGVLFAVPFMHLWLF